MVWHNTRNGEIIYRLALFLVVEYVMLTRKVISQQEDWRGIQKFSNSICQLVQTVYSFWVEYRVTQKVSDWVMLT